MSILTEKKIIKNPNQNKKGKKKITEAKLSTERLSNLLMVTQLISERAESHTQAVSLKNPYVLSPWAPRKGRNHYNSGNRNSISAEAAVINVLFHSTISLIISLS